MIIKWNLEDTVLNILESRGMRTKALRFCKNIHNFKLSEGGKRIYSTPNAGGNSVISEVLSYEVLSDYLSGVKLLHTEMELEYEYDSKITDYSISVAGEPIGVSVTRCMKYRGMLNKWDARRLLIKKIKGIVESSEAISEKHSWKKQILHIWVEYPYMVKILQDVYREAEIRSISPDTLLVLTVMESQQHQAPDLFYERDHMAKFY